MDGLMLGFEVALRPENLLAAVLGVLVGTIVGVLPGLGSPAAAAILFPVTFTMGPIPALIMIAGIYYGSMYGGSTTAILLNVPGEASAIPSTFEGYPLAQQGRGGAALTIVALGSFVTGTISVVLVTLFTPELGKIGVALGPIEYFAITMGGLLLLSRIMGGTLASGLLPMFFGLALGTVGADPSSGAYRFTFESIELGRGINIVPVAIGLFGVAELMRIGVQSRRKDEAAMAKVSDIEVGSLRPTREEFGLSVKPWFRGGVIGFLFGLLPGPAGTLSSFASYRVEKTLSKRKHLFGRGAMEGLAGPEAANNAAATSAIIPILAFGIPFSTTLALMLAAMITQGIAPGPLISVQHPDVFWGVIASMYIGNILCLILNLPLIRIWVKLLVIPKELLFPAVAVLAVYGAYASAAVMLDIAVVVAFALLGYLFVNYGYQLAPLLIGLLLGPLIERYFISSMRLGHGDLSILVSSTTSMWIWAGLLVVLLGAAIARRVGPLRQTKELAWSED